MFLSSGRLWHIHCLIWEGFKNRFGGLAHGIKSGCIWMGVVSGKRVKKKSTPTIQITCNKMSTAKAKINCMDGNIIKTKKSKTSNLECLGDFLGGQTCRRVSNNEAYSKNNYTPSATRGRKFNFEPICGCLQPSNSRTSTPLDCSSFANSNCSTEKGV